MADAKAATPALTTGSSPPRRQRVVRARRTYNQWVADQTLEDFALRFTAESGRKWSISRVTNTALGSIAFLACEAVGAAITLNYGAASTFWALGAMAVVIVLTGLPICYYAARYGVDMDLLTRGSGFGYIGSTITSAIYASFTFILFAFEAAILSAALELCLGIPLAVGHVISALIVLPVAAFGIRRIGALQSWTQPIWLVLQLAPLAYIALRPRAELAGWTGFTGEAGSGFSLAAFGAASAVLLSLLPQIGEQVDYLRFLPPRTEKNRAAWWGGLLLAGPGWILIGGVKILIGSVLAVMALNAGLPRAEAAQPATLYHMVFDGLLSSPAAALVLTGLFVAVCQIKINVTNAYAGSIASSNFFSRLTHRHPGRVVWLVFNVFIAIQLMQFGILKVVEGILALYANVAVAWIGAVTADLVINKPLGLSPKGVEFKRAHLYDINPVGVGAMAVSLALSMPLFFGLAGATLQTCSPIIGLLAALVAAPVIAWATGGRYYIARRSEPEAVTPTCVVCENAFEPPDMAFCPVYQGSICSLCCSLDARCHDACKTPSRIVDRAADLMRRLAPVRLSHGASLLMARYVGVLGICAAVIGAALGLIYYSQAGPDAPAGVRIGATPGMIFLLLMLLSAFAAWFFVLARENQRAAEDESDRQTDTLMEEIEAHRQTYAELQRAKEVAEAANLAKSRYIVGVSHEIRAPLNAISGYAQLMERQPGQDPCDAVRVIRRSATHLGDLVDGLLDISRIENGTLRIERARVNLVELLSQLVDMFRLQATAKGISFTHQWPDNLPVWIYTDEKRVRQILINLLSNAIKYTPAGGADFTIRWRGQVAEFEISDTGVGIAEADLERIFEPFERVGGDTSAPGVGLGLTITKLLTAVLGGELTVRSQLGAGSLFKVRLLLSEAPLPAERPAAERRATGYVGPRRKILVTDDDPTHLNLTREILHPLGFELAFARDGEACVEQAAADPPDLVMLDISMPGMDGWEAARRVRAKLGDAVVILMVSANAHDFSRSRREDDPHDDFLIKPYEIDDLLERLQTLLDLQWASSSAEAAE
jgi:signal transduction histidine kinase/ActR/RegA family two-component response regulator